MTSTGAKGEDSTATIDVDGNNYFTGKSYFAGKHLLLKMFDFGGREDTPRYSNLLVFSLPKDTEGSSTLKQVRNIFSIISLDVIILAFSIVDPQSFKNIKTIVIQYPILIVIS